MGILFGLTTALLWGAGDFLARYVTRALGSYRTLFFIQFIGLVSLGIYLLGTGELQQAAAANSWQPWLWAALAALLNIASSFVLYRAFEVGSLMLVSPIAASYAAVTILLSFLSGEALTPLHDGGIGLVLLGIIIASTTFTPTRVSEPFAPQKEMAARSLGMRTIMHGLLVVLRKDAMKGVGWAIAAALGYGTTFWILGFRVTPVLGSIIPVWLIRTLTPCVLVVCAPLARQRLTLPRGSVWWFIVGVSIFDTIAYITYTLGLAQGQVSLITILSSLYSAVTVLLAWIFLRERLQRNQWFGIGVIFVGITLVNI
ncbi:MAG: DMT family transporter [Ktedonobacteraceae bacterium]|nr:DMT family transporter [Ktedonobacteraceae bacterium]